MGKQGSDWTAQNAPWSLASVQMCRLFSSEHCPAFFGDSPPCQEIHTRTFLFFFHSFCSGAMGFPGRCSPFLKISRSLFCSEGLQVLQILGHTVYIRTCLHLVSCFALRSWRHNPVGNEPSPAASGSQVFDSFSRLSPSSAPPSSFFDPCLEFLFLERDRSCPWKHSCKSFHLRVSLVASLGLHFWFGRKFSLECQCKGTKGEGARLKTE